MHLIEQYALSCGVKIDKPSIETCFYPSAHSDYITLHASSGMEGKNYDYFNDVVELILPYLKKKNIGIIQIGDAKDRKINGCEHYNGLTNLSQSFYLIEKSILHLGNDSFSTHVASGFNKKIVCLYSVLFKECCGPYWGDKSDQILLEPDRGDNKPSFSAKEKPKSVNKIKPETIAAGVLDLLNIKHNLLDIETLFTGKDYHITSLAVVPNHIMPDSFAPGQPVNIWGNECFDERNIAQWAFKRKCNIFLNQPMRINYLKTVSRNVNQINYEVSLDTDENYLKALKKLSIPTSLYCKDESIINEIRLKLFDWDILHMKIKTKKDLDNADLLCDNSRYKNSRKVVSNGKTYASKAAYVKDISGEHDEVIDCPEFWEELDSLKIYNDKRNDNSNSN